jgi:ribosomal-protein-alanine N-acetyltransferase
MIETARLLLRPFAPDDLAAYAAIWAQPEVVRYLPNERDTTKAQDTAASFLEAWSEEAWQKGYWPWAVIERSGQRLIGHAGLRHSTGLDSPELIYMFDVSAWGQGYACEAALAACDFGRDTLRVDRITAVALAENAGSIGVLRKAGFLFLGETTADGLHLVRYDRRL